MKNLTKILLSIYVAIMMIAVACKKDELTPTTTPPTTTPPVVTKSIAKDITKFSFAALSPVVDATIDASIKAITATVPAGTDVTKLVPTITLSDKATVSQASGVAQDFSKEVSYTVTAEDGGTVVYKVNVKKEVVVASVAFTMTTKSKMPVIADMDSYNKVFFTINSKIYYLGASKASTRDFKYFFEYDPATDKWTQKADFPFKPNLDGTGFPVYSNFIHNGKAYFSNAYYGFIEYDPITDKWRSLNYSINNFYRNPDYIQGSLYGFGEKSVGSYEFDTEKFDSKKFKSYNMSGADGVYDEFNAGRGVRFAVDNKIYTQIFFDETATTKQRFNTYEVDYANGKYIKRASFEGEQKYNTMGNSGSGTKGTQYSIGYFVDGKVYYFAANNILIYDVKNNTFQATKPQNFYPNDFNSKVSGDYIIIGKSIYVLGSNNAVVSMQIP